MAIELKSKEPPLKKVVVISAANIFSGGPLSILKDCLAAVEHWADEYEIYALVNEVTAFSEFKGINLMEFPGMRKTYLHRIYYEYLYYKKLSKKLNPFLWLSLNDMSSNIVSSKRAVYCHNPSPFKRLVFRDIIDQPSLFFFTLFYRYIYRINIKKNDYVIVQQDWLREAFAKMFPVPLCKIIVATPSLNKSVSETIQVKKSDYTFEFFFPSFPRPFKNIEVIGDAVRYINSKGKHDFKVTLTLDGSENPYTKRIKKNYGDLSQLNFIGLVSREEVYNIYSRVDCLLFPSTLETWGLPITEFKLFKKPMIVADLPYAHETAGNYLQTIFFKPYDHKQLACYMIQLMDNTLEFKEREVPKIEEPYAENWQKLLSLLLKN